MDMHIINQVKDSYAAMQDIPDGYFDALILDPDYKDNRLEVKELKRICRGNIVVFCKPENQPFKADNYMFWNKPHSTKNFGDAVGRYVEMILVLRQRKLNRLHWSQMSGVYYDLLIEPPIHPYEKPETLIERMVRMMTKPGDMVGDFFCGSGTVPRVCKNLGRQCIGYEKENKYVRMAQARLLGATHDELRSMV